MKRKKFTVDDLLDLANKIKDTELKKLVIDFIKNPFSTHPNLKDQKILSLEDSPASVNHHHNYPNGLLEHTVSVTNLAIKLVEGFKKTYGLKINKDLVIAGALLHDLMKPYNYVENDGKFDHTDIFGIDHLTLMVAELYKRNYPLELIRIIASHHGPHSPTRPGSLEAYIVYYADLIDSEINNISMKVLQSRSKDLSIDQSELVKNFDPILLYMLRSKEGKEKLNEFLEKFFSDKL